MVSGRFAVPSNRPSPPLRSLLPAVLVVVTAAVAYAYRRRERRLWESRRISGGRKALALNLFDRS